VPPITGPALVPGPCPDIHIFWEQACGEALGKSGKVLIAKDFPSPRPQQAKNGQSAVPNARCTTRNDIHIFWEQACGEALDKPLKPLIPNNFSLTQLRLAKTTQIRPTLAFQLAPDSKYGIARRFRQDIHTFWEQACGQALDKRSK